MATATIPTTVTADEFLNKLTPEQRASLPEGTTIIGDLDLSIGAKDTLPKDLATLKLPKNLIIKGNLDISGSRIKDFPTLRELPPNLIVAGRIDAQFSRIKALPDGLNANVLDKTFNSDFSHSDLKEIGKDVVIHGIVDFSNTHIKSIVGIKPLVEWKDEETGDFKQLYDKFYSNAISKIILQPANKHEQQRQETKENFDEIFSSLKSILTDYNPHINDPYGQYVDASPSIFDRIDALHDAINNRAEQCSKETMGKFGGQLQDKLDEWLQNDAYRQITGEALCSVLKHNEHLHPSVMYIVENPNTPAEALAEVAKEVAKNMAGKDMADVPFEDKATLELIALNPSTPAEALVVLAKCEDPNVRMNVAGNDNTPIGVSTEVLTALARSENGDIRQDVAEHPNTPAEVLAMLANDKNVDVRAGVAGNPNTPADILVKFAEDPFGTVGCICNIASNPSTPASILAKLAEDKSYLIRTSVVENPNTPASLLAKLAEDEEYVVRLMVAKNPHTSAEVLAMLSKDAADVVRWNAATNPNTPAEMSNEDRIPTQIGNVKITQEQRLALQQGKSIVLSGVKTKTGEIHDTLHVKLFGNKLKLLKPEKKEEEQQQQPKIAQARMTTPAARKNKGLRM
jgi:Ni,Fe-hydrogenase III small subunit